MRAHVTTSAQPKAAAESVWTVVPWLISALYIALTVHRALAAGAGDMCMSCHLADALPPTYPTTANNRCMEMQSAADPVRMALNCSYSP